MVYFSFCLDTKRNKKSRLRLQPDPLRVRKLRQIKMIIADVYLSFNAFFSQRAPRASVDVDSLTGVSKVALTVGARYPFCAARLKE